MAIPIRDRCRAIERGLSLIQGGTPARSAWSQAAQEVGATASTLYRWYQRVHGQERSEWPVLLAPHYAGRPRDEISPEAWRCYMGVYRSADPPNMMEAYRALEGEARIRGWTIPTEAAFRRRVNRLAVRRSRYKQASV